MGATAVIKIEVAAQSLSGNGNGIVAVQIDFLVFHGLPEAFDKDVVAPAAFTVHADLNAILFEHADEGRAGELAALIGVHDLWWAVFQNGFFQRLNTRVSRQRVGQAPSENSARGPIEYGGKIDESLLHRDIRRVHGPDLIRSIDGEMA